MARLATLHRVGRRVGIPVIATLIAGGVLGWQMNVNQVHGAQIGALSQALDQQRAQAQRAGQTPIAPPPASILASPNIVKGDVGPTGPAGQNATDDQVYAAVASYFSSHPPGPSPVEIAAAVANYLLAHPPASGATGATGPAGQNATADQVASAVREYLVVHPPSPGPAGSTGPTGPGPTPEQIATAVRDYINAHPLPLCPDGTRAGARTVVTSDGPLDVVVCVRQKSS